MPSRSRKMKARAARAAPRPSGVQLRATVTSQITDRRLQRLFQAPLGYPDRALYVLPYEDIRQLTIGTGSADHVYELNSLYDPDYTGSGHQPRGYTQLSALWTAYRVLRVAFEISAQSTSAVGTGSVQLTVVPASSNTTIGAGAFPSELPRASRPLLLNAASREAVVRGEWSMAEILGWTASQYEASELTYAPVGASPSTGVYLHVHGESDTASSGADLTYVIRLRYLAEFSERPVLAIS